MKILRVRFFNINSLRGEHAVNFSETPLAEAGLFAITGATGAGKTTILDAITLALYGQVPRHETTGPEQVMSHGTGESWAEVEFEVSGQQYRAKWGQYRARKRPEGKLQDPRMELSERKVADDGTETWPFLETYKSRVPLRVAELSGLEYKQFLRSVLLAQGDFTRFLKATAGERAQLLEKITDTKKYSDISRAAFERAKHEAQQVENLRTGLAGVVLLSTEEVAFLETESQRLDSELTAATARRQQLQEAQAWLRRLHDLQARHQESQTRQLQLSAQTDTLSPLKQRLALHTQAAPFATDWALLRQADEHIARLRHEAGQLRQQLPQLQRLRATAATTRAAAQQAHDAATSTHQEQEPKLREAEQLDGLLREANRQLSEGKQAYQERNALWKEQHREATQAAEQHKLQQQQAHDLRDWLTRRAVLSTATEALAPLTGYLQDWQHIQVEIAELEQAHKVRQQQLQETTAAETTNGLLLQEAQQQLRATAAQLTAAATARADWQHQLTHHVARLHREELVQEAGLQDLRRLTQAHQLILTHEEARQHLTPGEACPLCGAVEHPYAAGVLGVSTDSVRRDREREQELTQQVVALKGRINRLASISGLLETDTPPADPETPVLRWFSEDEETTVPATVRNLVKELRALEQQRQQARLTQTKAEADLHHARTQQAQLRQELDQLTARLSDSREQAPKIKEIIASLLLSFQLQFSGDNGPALVQRLEDESAAFRQQQQELEKLERLLGVTEERTATAQKHRDQLQLELNKRREVLEVQNTAILAQQQQRQQLFSGPDVAQARRQLEEAVRQADARQRQAEQALQQHETTLALAGTQLAQREQDAEVQQQLRELQHATLTAALSAAGLAPNPAALTLLLLPDPEVRRLADQLQRHEQALAVTQQTLTDLAQLLHQEQARALTEESLELVEQQLATSHQQLATLNQQLGQRQQRLHDHRSGQERHAALAGQLELQQQEARRWRHLAEVIGSADGKKFSEFAQGLTLARLTDLANRHLHRLTDRYRILRNPDQHLDLLVVDEYQGGGIRSMNSLSGGESFLVSLALALGLSELASHRTQIDTLFIDEGFGTLDPDTLDMALSALEMLQGTGKTIGIISHVEALKERVTTQINVRKGTGGVSSLQVIGFGNH